MAKELNKNKTNRTIKQEREETYLGHLPAAYLAPPTGPAGPAHLHPLPCRLPPSPEGQRRGVARAREASATSCFLLDARRRHAPPCLSSSLSRVLILSPEHSPPPLFSSPERSRRHRREPPWLPATPRLTDAPGSSAPTPSSSPPIHGPPEALQRRPQARPQPSAAGELSRIRELRCLPELAEATAAPAVSSCAVSPSSLARFLPLTPMPVAAESFSPPAMAQPWP